MTKYKNLTEYDSGIFPNMSDSVKHYTTNPITMDAVSAGSIVFSGMEIRNFYNVFDKNKQLLMNNSFKTKFKKDWKYRPKTAAYELYGTTDLYYILMVMNNIHTFFDFKDFKEINVLDPFKIDIVSKIINQNASEIKSVSILNDKSLKRII